MLRCRQSPGVTSAVSTIALSTYSFGPECTATRAIDFALEHGFRGLELGSWTLWPERLSRAEADYVRVQAAANGIDLSIHFIHRGIAPASHDPLRRARHLADLEATLELAHDIGARPVIVHPGPIDCAGVNPAEASNRERGEAQKHLADFLSKGARMAERTGTVLCVENLRHAPEEVVRSYEEMVQLVESVGSPTVRITLDTGHADLADGLRPAFEAFVPYLRHIHVHDSDGKRDHHEIGRGRIDFAGIAELLESYPFTMSIESRDEQDEEGCVLRSRDRLKELLGTSAR